MLPWPRCVPPSRSWTRGGPHSARCTLQIKESKSHRPLAAAGSGVAQMKFVLRKYSKDNSIQEPALRFMAEAAIDPKTELKVFDAGGTDIAMAIGRQVRASPAAPWARQHAAAPLTHQPLLSTRPPPHRPNCH